MKYLTYALLATVTFGLQAAKPWVGKTTQTAQLPQKDKDKLNTLLESAQAVLSAQNEETEDYKKNSTLFNKTLGELSAQVDSITSSTGSLSGMLSSLNWTQRLEELKNSLNYILGEVNKTTAMRINKQNLINGLSEEISKINNKLKAAGK